MNSTLKVLLPIALVGLVVFGLTFISSYTPSDTTVGGGTAPPPVQLLRFATTEARYDPTSDQPAVRFYPPYYEVSDEEHPVSFWFQNVNPEPVKLSVLSRSCSSCTAARVAVVPSGAIAALVTRKNVGLPPLVLPAGAVPTPDLLGPLAAAALLRELNWHDFDFNKKEEAAEVPAGSPAAPTWGVIQVGVKIGIIGEKAVDATFGLQAGGVPPQSVRLKVTMYGSPPFIVGPEEINAGVVAEDGGPRTFDLMYWSATRHQDQFPPPSVSAPANDPILAAGKPVPLDTAQRQVFARMVQGDPKNPARPVLAAWRVPLTVLPPNPPRSPDIGPFERTVAVAGVGTSTSRVTVKGTVTGLVTLKEGEALRFGQFDARADASRTVTLVSARSDLDLEVVPEETRPPGLKVELGPPSMNGTRREWPMKVTVPTGAITGDLGDAVVVVRPKGEPARRVRIPLQGTSFRRS